MTKQELMINRYEVIADYPNSPFKKGDILEFIKKDNTFDIYMIKNNCIGTQIKNPYMYPHIFEKLKWYDKRKIEEMPEYLNFDGKIFKAIPGALLHYKKGYASYNNFCNSFDNVNLCSFEPATEEEYLSYLKDSK